MNGYTQLNDDDLIAHGAKLSSTYRSADPFPHIVLDDIFRPEALDAVLEEFPDLNQSQTAKNYDDPNQRKLASRGEQHFGPRTRDLMRYLNSEPFLLFLSEMTGLERPIIPDPTFEGGGLHQIKTGGFLKIHTDFNIHRHTELDRRLNALIYLNKDWPESYGGHLELWDRDMNHCVARVLPTFGRLVVFNTDDFSYHGHPDPITCPEDRARQSLAVYYYSNGRPAEELNSDLGAHSTLFQTRPGGEGSTRILPSFGLRRMIKRTIAKLR